MLNPWALDKDRSIKRLLVQLGSELGCEHFELGPLEVAHRQAVMLCRPDEPDIRAYLYSYAQHPGTYGVHLEYPEFPDSPPPAPEIRENLPPRRLVELLAIHFDLPG
jgi:hypothetical protein